MADIKAKIAEISVKIEQLDRQFNLYFIGQESMPPVKQFELLKRDISHLMSLLETENNSGNKFAGDSLVQKYTTYRNKWERGLRDIEDGRTKPGIAFYGGLGHNIQDMNNASLKREQDIYSARHDDTAVNNAAEQYVDLAKKYLSKNYDKQAVAQTLQQKIKEVKEKYGDNFKFNVYFDGTTVRIKPEKSDE